MRRMQRQGARLRVRNGRAASTHSVGEKGSHRSDDCLGGRCLKLRNAGRSRQPLHRLQLLLHRGSVAPDPRGGRPQGGPLCRPDWEGQDIRAGLWGVGHDQSGDRTAFPIIEYHQDTGLGFTGWRVWDGSIDDWGFPPRIHELR